MPEESDILWLGEDAEGIKCQISRKQWQEHVAKQPEIGDALELTKAAMQLAKEIEPDGRRPVDEAGRYFRLLCVAGRDRWARHVLVVSVKYVRQSDGCWIKFYQSCWYERSKERL